MGYMEEDGDFICSKCGKKDTPEGFAYIGPKDRSDTACNPMLTVLGDWEQICFDCEPIPKPEPIQPHQQRVIDEKVELDKKATALSEFIGNSPIFETINSAEQERLKEQNDIMWQYSEILGARIAEFIPSNQEGKQ
jgi:hypothetical protein